MTLKRITALAALLASLGSAQAAVIYGPSLVNESPRLSDLGANGAGWRTFDDFTLTTGASVERVRWRGFWLDQNNPVPAPAPAPDVLTWDIAFYANNGGVPGSQLALQTFSAAAANQVYLGSGGFSGGGSFNVDFFGYYVDLAAPVALDAGDTYWVSVMARSPTLQPAFAWSGATGGNNNSYQQRLTAGEIVDPLATGSVAQDRAVVLEGTLAVPEPAALPLVGTALLLLAGLRRRQRWQRR